MMLEEGYERQSSNGQQARDGERLSESIHRIDSPFASRQIGQQTLIESDLLCFKRLATLITELWLTNYPIRHYVNMARFGCANIWPVFRLDLQVESQKNQVKIRIAPRSFFKLLKIQNLKLKNVNNRVCISTRDFRANQLVHYNEWASPGK